MNASVWTMSEDILLNRRNRNWKDPSPWSIYVKVKDRPWSSMVTEKEEQQNFAGAGRKPWLNRDRADDFLYLHLGGWSVRIYMFKNYTWN